MANRRMFSKVVTDSDSFLSMSLSAQALYFHLGMQADDDGFVPLIRVSKMLGTSHDDSAQLFGRGFVLQVDIGVIVVRDWKINNEIRADRYSPTIFKSEKDKLILNEQKQYQIVGTQVVLPNDNQMETQVRLGKVSIGKDNTSEAKPSQEIVSVIDSFSEVNPSYKKWYANKTQRSAISRLVETHGLEQILKVIKLLRISNSKEYMPVITTPLQLEDKYAQLASAMMKLKNNQPVIL